MVGYCYVGTDEKISPAFAIESILCKFAHYPVGLGLPERQTHRAVRTRDAEAVEYFLLPLSAPYKVSRFQLIFSKCFRIPG